MAALDTSLVDLVGKTAKALEKGLGLRTVEDLLRHYPRRYDERGGLTDLTELEIGEQVTVLAEVRKVSNRRMRNRRGSLLEVVVGDGSRSLTLTFFNQAWRERQLKVGTTGLFSGKVADFRGARQLNKPDYLLFSDDGEDADDLAKEFAGALIPVYAATAELPTWTIARSVRVVLDQLDPVPDPLPSSLRAAYQLADLTTALHDIHRPSGHPALGAARKRLKWDEALVLQLTLAQRRRHAAADPATPRPLASDGVAAAFDAALPFTLTDGQREVGSLLSEELAREHPMHRLLQGEVGSGKTLVALRAMLQVVDGGGQAAMLAPTEVLAAQHARGLTRLLGALAQKPRAGELGEVAGPATRIALLTGSLPAAAKRAALLDAATGDAGIVVGTHALIQDQVSFFDLGMVVVDEQHRFGVEQRDALRAKGKQPPHVLVMTATPIPRTVAMTVYGDLETSSLRELPRGRSPISSTVVPAGEKPAWLERVWQRIREEVGKGHQAYVVCPRIGDAAASEDVSGDDEKRPPLAVADVAPMLASGPLDGLRLEVLHGRLAPEEKDRVMGAFAAGEVDVLVATTVVEVGVDVPNATVMAVMDADRFGVSQLHQLRGRVGRGSAPGLCLLVTDAAEGTPARARLDAVASTADGFELSRLDLEQRREGDVLGAAQSGGKSGVKLLSLLRDEELIGRAREAATEIVRLDPSLEDHPGLASAVAALMVDEKAEYLEKG